MKVSLFTSTLCISVLLLVEVGLANVITVAIDGTGEDCIANDIPNESDICSGDSNCDGEISWPDIDYFVAAMNDNVAVWEAMFAPGSPTCFFANNDVNSDGTVNWRDIDEFVALMNTVCE